MIRKRIAAALALVMLAGSLAACSSNVAETTAAATEAAAEETEAAAAEGEETEAAASDEELPLAGKRIAYILNVVSSDIFQMAATAAEETAEALGATVDVYFTDTDNVRFQDTVSTCANQGYDAMFLSHGNQETSYDLVSGLIEQGIEVVCFDTQFVDESGNTAEIPGATQMFQNDQEMAAMLLDYILELYPEKVEAGEPVNVLKIWRGPGVSPFDRRQEAYLEYEESGKINTLETLGPSDPANGEASMAQVMAAALPKYPEGTVDAIWCVYDAYGRGAYTALREAGRTDIPMVSVDISNQDLNFMMDGTNVWQACATVDFTTIGQQGIRILAMKLHGDETEAVYNLTPSLVTYDKLTPESNVTNLGEIIPGYGVNNDHIAEWMEPYIPIVE